MTRVSVARALNAHPPTDQKLHTEAGSKVTGSRQPAMARDPVQCAVTRGAVLQISGQALQHHQRARVETSAQKDGEVMAAVGGLFGTTKVLSDASSAE